MSEYIAGSCNIGQSEIKRRKQGAILGGILYLVTAISFLVTDAPTSTRLISFIPAMLLSAGFIQSRRKFCVAYGFLGIFNFEKLGNTKQITINQDLKADRRYAVRLLLQSAVAAIVLTGVVIFI